jgi:hypothetical protein
MIHGESEPHSGVRPVSTPESLMAMDGTEYTFRDRARIGGSANQWPFQQPEPVVTISNYAILSALIVVFGDHAET